MVVYNPSQQLPILSIAAAERSSRLVDKIVQEVEANDLQSISFARFMEMALYAPDLGYYATDCIKLGKEGDYLTAPEMSPYFAGCVAAQCKQIMQELPDTDILELGAGTGILAKDILLTLEKQSALPNIYYIFEISADLRKRQKHYFEQFCPHLLERIQWLENLSDFQMTGIIIANEVMDALPVHCITIERQQLYERRVAWDGHQFTWCLAPATPSLLQDCQFLLQEFDLPNFYCTEINLSLPTWIASLANGLQQGAILLFDYGYSRKEYYHPDRRMGTLQCYYAHHRHDNPFSYVGLQDITAHVDFSSVIESAIESGCSLAGFTTQSGFLLSFDVLNQMALQVSSAEWYHYAHAMKRLIMPAQMGEPVKAMALSKALNCSLKGFSQFDRSKDL